MAQNASSAATASLRSNYWAPETWLYTSIRMDIPTIARAWAAVAIFFFCYFLLRGKKSSSTRLPPGPRPLPVIGNLHLLAQQGKLPHQILTSLAREYGPLMTLRLGSHRVVVATDAKKAKEILKTQNHHFASRPETTAANIMNYQRAGIVWAPYGEYHKRLRKIVLTKVLSSQQIASFQNPREQEVLSAVKIILQDCEEGTVPIVLDDKMSQLSTNLVSRMLFGKSLFGRNSELITQSKKFMTTVRELFRLSGVVVIGDYLPYLKRLDIQGYEAQMRKVAKASDELYTMILDEHRDRRSCGSKEGQDFVDTLLSLPPEEALSDITIKALIDDTLLAGTDTSSNQLSWTFAELMRHPEILAKVEAELDSVVGRERLVTEADIPNLVYLQALVKESFRLHPGAVLLPYKSTDDAYIDGFHIPAQTRILINNHAISRDPATWENPLLFNPERFLDNSGSNAAGLKGHDFEMLPFGGGRRRCIGMNLGLLMVQFTLALFLQTCHWSLPPGVSPQEVDLTEGMGITIPLKTPLKIIATPRLPNLINSSH